MRFLLVGGFNTVFGYSLFALLTWLGLPYPAAIGLATIVGVAVNFQTTGRLVFGEASWHRSGRFVAVYMFTYVVNVASVALLLKLELNVYMANALVLVPLAVLTYLLQRTFVFN